jgi:DnaJ-class molecular chaperone
VAAKSEEEKAEAEQEFMKIGSAYEILNDEETRAKYDRGEDVTGKGQQGHGAPQGHHRRHGNFHFHFRN